MELMNYWTVGLCAIRGSKINLIDQLRCEITSNVNQYSTIFCFTVVSLSVYQSRCRWSEVSWLITALITVQVINRVLRVATTRHVLLGRLANENSGDMQIERRRRCSYLQTCICSLFISHWYEITKENNGLTKGFMHVVDTRLHVNSSSQIYSNGIRYSKGKIIS